MKPKKVADSSTSTTSMIVVSSEQEQQQQEQQQQTLSLRPPRPLDSGACRSNSFAVGDFDPTRAEPGSENSEEDATNSNMDNSCDDDDKNSTTRPFSVVGAGAAEDDLDNLVPVDERLAYASHVGQHPELRSVCVMDCSKEREIVPNSDQPFHLENECFVGKVMLLMRTPDVDHHRDPNILGPVQREVSEYFKGKKRRFEFQFQIKLKRVPEGALFLGCELEHGISVGRLTKGLVNLLLAMVRRINPGFHHSWGPSDGHGLLLDPATLASGDYEKTHLSFPVEASMDRIVITKPGEAPPTLGQELMETNESVRRRRKMGAGSVVWNTTDTFTMCLWSAYADWIKWKSINVPGVSPFSLTRVTGTQPIYLSVYEITACPAEEYKRKRPPHLQKDLNIYTRFEFSNIDKTAGGLAEKILGRRGRVGGVMLPSSEHSLPDTESLSSDFETTSRVSHITS